MSCESRRVSTVNGRILRPRPSTEKRALVVAERALQFFLRVHDERAVLSHGLADWTTLEQQHVCRSVNRLNRDRLIRLNLHGRRARHQSPGNAQRRACEEVEGA